MADHKFTRKTGFFEKSTPEELAEKFGTPLYIYNERILRDRCRKLKNLSSYADFGVNYSVKANSNPALLKIIRHEGLVVDAMSPGELCMDLLAGYTPQEILYISNNNTVSEFKNIIRHGCITSLDSLSQIETLGQLAPGYGVMVRLNPGIGAGHHAKVITGGSESKFGINFSQFSEIMQLVNKYRLKLVGLNQHIGSLFMEPAPYLAAARVLLDFIADLPGEIIENLQIIDFGGGFGIPYHKEDQPLDMAALGREFHELISGWSAQTGYKGRFLVEPGRYVVAECGLLLGRVTAVKNNGPLTFVGTDLGFNVLMRPVLYDSFHEIEIYSQAGAESPVQEQTIVGNICESGDILAKNRLLNQARTGDLAGVLDAGAYGFSMASNYNDRLLPAEVLLTEDGKIRQIRRRQNLNDLTATLEDIER